MTRVEDVMPEQKHLCEGCRARKALMAPRTCRTLAAVEKMAPSTASVITASRVSSQSTIYWCLLTRFE